MNTKRSRFNMEKVFIFSDSYDATNFIYCMNYLFIEKVKEIILLKENHTIDDFKNNNIKITLLENIDDCIKNSTDIIILKNVYLVDSNIEYLINQAKQKNISPIILDMNNDNKYQFKHVLTQSIVNYISRRPIILHLYTGLASQETILELTLNNIFSKFNIDFNQYFSPKTFNILNELKKYQKLNNRIKLKISKDENDFALSIISINITNRLSELKNYINIIKQIKPDFLIIQTSNNIDINREIKNVFKFGCFKEIDIIIRSNYILYDNLFKIKSSKVLNNVNEYYLSEEIEKILEEKIYEKISLPYGVKRIN